MIDFFTFLFLIKKWTHYDFQQVLDIFHEGIQFYPPPKHPFVWYFVLLFFWFTESGLIYYVMATLKNPSYVFILPILLILTALLFSWRYKSLRAKVKKKFKNKIGVTWKEELFFFKKKIKVK